MAQVTTNIKAFAMVLWNTEGTYTPNSNAMYRTLYGGSVLPDTPATWAHHPDRNILKWGNASTAAGAYQFLYSTWVGIAAKIALPDFTPISQDRAFCYYLQTLHESGISVYDLLNQGNLSAALGRTKGIWTSLPGGPQQEKTLAQAQSIYSSAGGSLA